MGMTCSQKILANKIGAKLVRAGDLIECKLDLVFGNDITAPVAIDEFYRMGAKDVFDRNKVALIPDHFTPNKDIASATLAKKMREFAQSMNIKHYFEVGRGGIEHVLLPEKGLISPGDVVIGADSHSCTHGALGAFATGVGSTDMATGMVTGKAWFKVPEAIGITLTGKKQPHVSGKDIILYIIGQIGVDGARYMSLEFSGDISELDIDERLTIANMAIECGAKNCVFPVDACTVSYLESHGAKIGTAFEADADAVYARSLTVDLSKVLLTVSFPHLPENARSINEAQEIKIAMDQVVIGSCTNGRISDMRIAAEILRGHRVADNVRAIIIPATQKVWQQCVQEGLMDIFTDAGAIVSAPTCGPCLGGYMGVLADGEKCLSTTNRNFVGRMGHKNSEVYLASPAVAAATAITGYISHPNTITGR